MDPFTDPFQEQCLP